MTITNAPKAPLAVRICEACGIEYQPIRWDQRRCGADCRVSGSGKPLIRESFTVSTCEVCTGLYKPIRSDQRYCGYTCRQKGNNARRAPEDGPRAASRRAIKYGVPYEPGITRSAIAKVTGWVCAICGEDINPRLRWPNPLSKSLDHIVPMSRGGGHVLENCQLAHLVCNQRKGVKVDAGSGTKASGG